MKLVTWNVNGIRAVHRKELFSPMIEKIKPDVICLQETKAQQYQSPLDLSDYHEYWNSAEKKGYSGVAIFSKEKPISIINNFPKHIVKKYKIENDGYGNPDTEGRVIAIELKKVFVVCVYTPNAKSDLSRVPLRAEKWDPAFLEFCKELEEKKPVLFCGDLNVAHTFDDLENPKSNVGKHGFTDEERSGIDKILNAGFIDTFRMFHQGNKHYTWWSNFGNARARNVGWRIDYWFVSKKLKNKVIDTIIYPEIMGSDHCPVLLDINL